MQSDKIVNQHFHQKNRHYKGRIVLKKRFHEKNNQNFNATFVKKTLPKDDFELEKKNEKRLHQGSTP